MTVQAAIYARISDDRDATALGVARQVEDCEAEAAKRGWVVADRYVDNDVSAYSGKVRREYRRMLEDIASGRIEAVVAYHLDRLHRQPRELEHFFDVCDRAGVKLMATVQGDIDLGTDDGRFHARIMGAVARKASDDQSRRLRRKALELAQAGEGAGGGSRPFGFEEDRVAVRDSEAAVIQEMAGRLLGGESLRGLASDLNARGVLTSTGGIWHPGVLRRLLSSARVSGQREHHGEVVADAVWPAIITPAQTTAIRRLLADPARKAARMPRSYVLKGLVRCARCDKVMVARPRADGQRRYVCAKGPGLGGCNGTMVLAPVFEAWVTEAAFTQLESDDFRKILTRDRFSDSSAVADMTDRLEAQLEELAHAYAEGAISMREWMAARAPIQARVEASRRQGARRANMMAVAEHIGDTSRLRRDWAQMSVDARHAVLAAVVSTIIVRPGVRGRTSFDPDRFEIVWRR